MLLLTPLPENSAIAEVTISASQKNCNMVSPMLQTRNVYTETGLCTFGCFRMARESSQKEYEKMGHRIIRKKTNRRANDTPSNFMVTGKSFANKFSPVLVLIP